MNSPFIAAASMDITQKGLAMRKGMDNCSQQVTDNVTHIIEKHHPSNFTKGSRGLPKGWMRVEFVGFSRISEVACRVGRLSMDSDHSAMTQLRRATGWDGIGWIQTFLPRSTAKWIDVRVVQPVMTHPWGGLVYKKKWYALSRFTWMRFVGHLCIDSASSFKALLPVDLEHLCFFFCFFLRCFRSIWKKRSLWQLVFFRHTTERGCWEKLVVCTVG